MGVGGHAESVRIFFFFFNGIWKKFEVMFVFLFFFFLRRERNFGGRAKKREREEREKKRENKQRRSTGAGRGRTVAPEPQQPATHDPTKPFSSALLFHPPPGHPHPPPPPTPLPLLSFLQLHSHPSLFHLSKKERERGAKESKESKEFHLHLVIHPLATIGKLLKLRKVCRKLDEGCHLL